MQRAAYGRKRFDEMSTKLDKLLLCCEILIQPKKKGSEFHLPITTSLGFKQKSWLETLYGEIHLYPL